MGTGNSENIGNETKMEVPAELTPPSFRSLANQELALSSPKLNEPYGPHW